MLFFKKTLFLLLLACTGILFSITSTSSYPLTVNAVLTCPLNGILKEFSTLTELPLSELEIGINRLVHAILEGNKEALINFIDESYPAQTRTLTIDQCSFIRRAFSISLEKALKNSNQDIKEPFIAAPALALQEQENPSFLGKGAVAQALVNVIKKYTKGEALLSLASAQPNHVALLKLGASHLLSRHIPYASLLKGVAGVWSTARRDIKHQNTIDKEEDALINSSALTQIAHIIAEEKIVRLFYIAYSPQSHPCDRIKALFLLNHSHLMGTSGRLFNSFIAQFNYFYFSEEGTLRAYDPTTAATEKEIMRFVQFLKKFCTTQEQYLALLKEGGFYGIATLQNSYIESREKRWKRKKESRIAKYSFALVKGILGCDLALKRVDPVIVRRAKTTRDFIKLINLCEIDATHEPSEKEILRISTARAIVAQCKKEHRAHSCSIGHFMQRYFDDAFSRFTLPVRTALKQKPSW